MLPTFIIIGAMKTGTTSLHHYLSLHPDIGMSHRKELDFFKTDADFAKGPEWYSAQFPSGYSVLGESSPNYSKCHLFPGVAERLHSILPEISLIYLVRHPVDRAVSHYVHQVSAGRESRTLDEAFQNLEQNACIPTGAYMFQLRQFLKFYPAERMLIVDSSELLNDRMATISRVFRFLGVNDGFSSENFANIHHAGSSKRHSNMLDSVMSRVPSVTNIILARVLRVLRKRSGAKIERPVPSAELTYRLLDYYRDDIAALEQFTGRKFHSWHAPPTNGM